MPKAFSDHEKATIRRQLHAAGQELFARHGLKKTSVDDLTQAAGISKGAFYLFYSSKEELLMEILEEIEVAMQTRILEAVIRNDRDDRVAARQKVSTVLTQFLLLWEEYPLLKEFGQEEYMLLVRKLPAARVELHQSQDERFIDSMVKKFAQEGIALHAPPHVMTNLLKSLFLVGLHRDDLGDAAYQETMTILVDLVAGYLVGEQ